MKSYALYKLLLCCLLAGVCSLHAADAVCQDKIETADEKPRISVGDDIRDYKGIYPIDDGNILLAEAAQFHDSVRVLIDNIEYVVVIGCRGCKPDGSIELKVEPSRRRYYRDYYKVFEIYTNDRKFRDKYGLGVGSTNEEIEAHYDNWSRVEYQFIEWRVEVGEDIVFGFPLDDLKTVSHVVFDYIPYE